MNEYVLLSGGADSATLLADRVGGVGAGSVVALTLDYGQINGAELECATWQAERYGVKHEIIDIKSVFAGIENPLLGHGEIPAAPYSVQFGVTQNGKIATYLPNRNMILLSIAAARALANNASVVCTAIHKADSDVTYPDCGQQFAQNMEKALRTQGIELFAPWVRNHKVEIIRTGVALGVDYAHTASCYHGTACGKCGACLLRRDAMKQAGVTERDAIRGYMRADG